MQIGLKLYPDSYRIAEKVHEEVDFFELMASRKDREAFNKFEKLQSPVSVIHNEHWRFGINISDGEKHEMNMQSVSFAQDIADRFGSRFIILHPGIMENNANLETMIDFYRSLGDKRIITENLPFISKAGDRYGEGYGRMPEEIGDIMEYAGIGLCFDFGHAWSVAFGLGKDHLFLTKRFLELNPLMYHFYDSLLDRELESHLNIGDGDADMRLFKSLLPSDALVSLETKPDMKKQLRDIGYMRNPL